MLGAALVMTSALAAAAARWNDVSVVTRLGLLAVLQAAAFAAGERMPRRLPVVGRVLLHLGALLVLPLAITATAQLGGSWRACTLAGGVAATAAAWIQSRRAGAPLLLDATGATAVVGAAGAAALTGVPIAVIVSVLALAAASAGWNRRAVLLAAAAVATPVSACSAALGIGRGTLRELGATGPVLGRAAAIAGVISCAALLIVARSTRSAWHVAGAGVAACSAVVVPLLTEALPPIDVLTVVAGFLLLVEIAVVSVDLAGAERARTALHRWTDGIDMLEILSAAALVGLFGTSNTLGTVLATLALCVGALRPRRTVPAALPAVGGAIYAWAAGAEWRPSFGPVAASIVLAVVGVGRGRIAAHRPGSADGTLVTTIAGLPAGVAIAWNLAEQLDEVRSGRPLAAAITIALAAVALALPRRGHDAAGAFAVTAAFGAVAIADRSLIAVTAGIALTVAAHRTRRTPAMFAGQLLTLCGAVWWLLDVGTADDALIMAAVGVVAIVEQGIRRITTVRMGRFDPTALAAAVLLVGTTAGSSPTRLVALAAIGMAMAAYGAVREQRISFGAGAAMTAGAAIAAADSRITALPVWVWVMVGGIGLIAAAAGVELRRGRRTEADALG